MPRKLGNCPRREIFEPGLEDEFWNLICRGGHFGQAFWTGQVAWTKAEKEREKCKCEHFPGKASGPVSVMDL